MMQSGQNTAKWFSKKVACLKLSTLYFKVPRQRKQIMQVIDTYYFYETSYTIQTMD